MIIKIKLAIIAMLVALSMVVVMPVHASESGSIASATTANLSPDYLLDAKNLDPVEKNLMVQVFGGEFVGEEGSTAISKAMGYLNLVALFFGTIIVTYVVLTAVVNTATSGQMLGQKWSSVWLPLRTSLGVGFLMPASTGGDYSIIQSLMAKILISSSIAATSVWNMVADDILSFKTSFVAGMPAPPTSQSMDLVGSAFCAVNEYYRRNGEGRSAPFPLYTIVVGDKDGKSTVKTVTGQPGGSPYSLQGGSYIKSIRFGSTGNCGSIEVADKKVDNQTPGTSAAVAAASQVVIDILNKAHQLENEARERKVNSRNVEVYLSSSANADDEYEVAFRKQAKLIADAGAQIISAYPSAMYKAVTGGFQSATNLDDAREKLMSQKSWLFAPMNYLRMTQHSMAPNSVFQKLGEGISNNAWRMCQPGANDCAARSNDPSVKAITTSYTHVSTMLVVGEIESAINSVNTSSKVLQLASSSETPSDGASGCTGAGCKQDAFVRSYTSQARDIIFTADLMGKAGQAVSDNKQSSQEGVDQISIGNFNGGANPYFVLSGIGHSLNTLLGITWGVGLGAATFAHALGDSVLAAGGAGGIPGAFEYVLKTVWPLFLAMVMVGATLAYIIPMLIILRWIWAVLNWLLLLVEAMTAAPLAVIMMLTPEGDGIAGAKTERAIMLVAQIILWPTLLVISYLTAVVLSTVGFSFVNMVWFTDAIRYNDNGFFDFVAKVFIWATVMTTLCHACAGVIDTLPKVVFEWFGGGISRALNNDPEKHAEQSIKGIESKMQQSVAKAGEGLISKPKEDGAEKPKGGVGKK